MSGYIGYSRSVRSQRAINEGKMTATDFAKWVKRFSRYAGCTAADVSEAMTPCEWHHTSKVYNRTNYYDPRDLLDAATRQSLASVIATRKAGASGSLEVKFGAEAEARGLTITKPYAGSTLLHAVDANGIVYGQCRTASNKIWGHKAGISWK